MKKTFVIASVIAAITSAAMATNGDKTVASKSYVDTKQVMIPATGTNSSTLGDTVVTYTSTAGTIGERGIATSAGDDADDLVSLGLLNNFAEYADETFVSGDSLTEATVHDLTCVDNDCELYNVTEMTVYKPVTSCLAYGAPATSASQCCSGILQKGMNKCGCIDDSVCTSPDWCLSSYHQCGQK